MAAGHLGDLCWVLARTTVAAWLCRGTEHVPTLNPLTEEMIALGNKLNMSQRVVDLVRHSF